MNSFAKTVCQLTWECLHKKVINFHTMGPKLTYQHSMDISIYSNDWSSRLKIDTTMLMAFLQFKISKVALNEKQLKSIKQFSLMLCFVLPVLSADQRNVVLWTQAIFILLKISSIVRPNETKLAYIQTLFLIETL